MTVSVTTKVKPTGELAFVPERNAFSVTELLAMDKIKLSKWLSKASKLELDAASAALKRYMASGN